MSRLCNCTIWQSGNFKKGNRNIEKIKTKTSCQQAKWNLFQWLCKGGVWLQYMYFIYEEHIVLKIILHNSTRYNNGENQGIKYFYVKGFALNEDVFFYMKDQ